MATVLASFNIEMTMENITEVSDNHFDLRQIPWFIGHMQENFV